MFAHGLPPRRRRRNEQPLVGIPQQDAGKGLFRQFRHRMKLLYCGTWAP